MIVAGFALGFLAMAVIAIFAFPALSPIPYFPSNRRDLKKILAALNLRNDQTVVDLGAGGGLVVFEAATLAYQKHLNTFFVADEINPVLFLVMHIKRLFHPNRKNIRVVLKDMFKIHQVFTPRAHGQGGGSLTFYLYVSPWFLERIYNYLKSNFKKFTVISYMYEIPGLKPQKTDRGVHEIRIY